LAGRGGLTWIKRRNGSGTEPHVLVDTVRGSGKYLASNTSNAQIDNSSFWTYSFGSSVSTVSGSGSEVNNGAGNYVAWTFRKQAKFFDVVTYTGTGTTLTVPHNLGSVPGCIIIKWTSGTGYGWYVYHRDTITGNPEYSKSAFLVLNSTAAASYLSGSPVDPWINVSSTNFQILTGDGGANYVGGTFVAYLFAHDAGGFGTSGNDNVITCGSFTTNGSGNATVNLGYEPQWVLYRLANVNDDWWISDNKRGMSSTQNLGLFPDRSDVESNQYPYGAYATATGFTYSITVPSATGIYIAIRRP